MADEELDMDNMDEVMIRCPKCPSLVHKKYVDHHNRNRHPETTDDDRQ